MEKLQFVHYHCTLDSTILSPSTLSSHSSILTMTPNPSPAPKNISTSCYDLGSESDKENRQPDIRPPTFNGRYQRQRLHSQDHSPPPSGQLAQSSSDESSSEIGLQINTEVDIDTEVEDNIEGDDEIETDSDTEMDNLDGNEAQPVVQHKRAYKSITDPTRCQVKTLRSDVKWTLRQIGDYTGLPVTTVHRILTKTPARSEHVALNRRSKFPEETKNRIVTLATSDARHR